MALSRLNNLINLFERELIRIITVHPFQHESVEGVIFERKMEFVECNKGIESPQWMDINNNWISITKQTVNQMKSMWEMELKSKNVSIILCDSAMQIKIKLAIQSPYCVGYKWID
eukprot:492767_1